MTCDLLLMFGLTLGGSPHALPWVRMTSLGHSQIPPPPLLGIIVHIPNLMQVPKKIKSFKPSLTPQTPFILQQLMRFHSIMGILTKE